MKALIIDDDLVLADLLAFTLRRDGFEILQAQEGEAGLELWEQERPDLILLDVNLSTRPAKLNGFEICRHIRRKSDIPILLLTVRSGEDDIITGLRLGADDYILKPFSPRQLLARIHAVLRRAGVKNRPTPQRVDVLALDASRREMSLGQGMPIALTTLECKLLEYFMLHPGYVLGAREIIDHLWGPGKGDRAMLRQVIHRLRVKIESNPAQTIQIENVHGVGYCLKLI